MSEGNATFNPIQNLDEQVQAVIDARLAEVEAKYQARIDDLEARLATVPAPATAVPEHAGGKGYEYADTWSMAEQERARAEV